MGRYLLRRLFYVIPTMFFVSVLVFLLVRFIPGNVVDMMVAEMGGGGAAGVNREAAVGILTRRLGLDVPIPRQYARWISDVFRGDLGQSLWTNKSISADILEQLPVSLELGCMAMLLSLVFSLPIGIFSAMRQETWGDYAGRTVSILAISIPALWLGTTVMVYPSIWWNWTPPVEYIPFGENMGGNILQFLLPASIMGLGLAGMTMRMTRTMMLEVLRQDYIRTAWSKGLKELTIVRRHALKNAFIPILTVIGNQFPILIGESAVLEQIFGLPGIGRYLVNALLTRDYPVISGVTLVMTGFIMAVNIMVDILYIYLDPRLRYDYK